MASTIPETRARSPDLTRCFGANIERYTTIVQLILRAAENVTYSFMPLGTFLATGRESYAKANQIYWREMLGRAHLASCSSLRRNLGWMDAVAICAAHNSFLGFAASLRGLIESTGDSIDVLNNIPENVSRDYRVILQCVEGRRDNGVVVSREMEDELIAYSHARRVKKSDAAPKSHKAKPTQYYIDLLDKTAGLTRVSDLYSLLCDVMHPAMGSVTYQFRSELGQCGEALYHSDLTTDKLHIEGIIAEFRQSISGLVHLAFDPGLITLRVLHSFKLFPKVPELRKFKFVLQNLADDSAVMLKR